MDYTLHAFSLATILLLIIVNICYYCIKDRLKQKIYITIKMESNNELKEVDIKNGTCYCFNDVLTINNLDLGNI